ncbi:methyltransferase domain-containing protein [Psychroserpens sp.]|uniref:methyltransferase domain-containing protein n=1 Tax=Psychroserpens sp. TaxID=2020870 RepID=UPI002B27AD29|nr:methyltransferase domain-containing protein [Psychroserpens sp.]
MKSISIAHSELEDKSNIELIDFYNQATEDYEFWSHDFNMHFGYFRPLKTNILKRDSMLNEMNDQVLKRLQINTQKHRLVDLGCGMGATMRRALSQFKNLIAYGVTISDFQQKKGNELLEGKNGVILKENYNKTSFQSNSFDSAVAIESFCHSGHDKKTIMEAFRVLKSGGRLIIVDAFLKKEVPQLTLGSHFAYKKLCNHFNLEKIEQIQNYELKLKQVGFTDVKIEDISLRVAPSVFHVPFAIVGFMLKKLWQTKSLKRESLHNLKGSFYALLSGLHMKSFGYYIITATK